MTESNAPDGLRAALEALADEWHTRSEAFKGTGIGDAYTNAESYTRSLLNRWFVPASPVQGDTHCQEYPDIELSGMRCEMTQGLHTHLPAPPVQGDTDDLAAVVARAMYERVKSNLPWEMLPERRREAWLADAQAAIAAVLAAGWTRPGTHTMSPPQRVKPGDRIVASVNSIPTRAGTTQVGTVQADGTIKWDA